MVTTKRAAGAACIADYAPWAQPMRTPEARDFVSGTGDLAGGEVGAREVLCLLKAEIDLAIALCGCAAIEVIGASLARGQWT